MQASGTYTIENAPECGASSRATLSSGNLVYEVLDYVEMAGFGLGVLQIGFLYVAMEAGMPPGLASLVLQSSAPFTVVLGALLILAVIADQIRLRYVASLKD